MKEMKKILIILIIGILAACSDFLEPKSQSEYIPKEAAALNEMLLGNAYPVASNGKHLLDIVSLLDDDVMCTDSEGEISKTAQSNSFIALKALFSWQPNIFKLLKDNMMEINPWGDYYALILGTNAALDYIDDVSGSVEEKSLVKAQALALRAFYYFQMVNIFGESYNYNKKGLGVPLKMTSELEKRDIPRNTVEEVYNQILEDLGEAEKLYISLPKTVQFKKDYRTSLPMVQLLKSRVYLYMEDWENAAIYAKKVIDDWDFSLTDLNALPEKSIANPYYNFISMDCTETIWVFGEISKYTNFLTTIVVIDDYWKDDATIGIKFFNVSDDLYRLYVDGDLRKENYIVRSMFKDSKGERYDGDNMALGKFAISSEREPRNGENFAHAFRLPEAYLNLAEAAAKGGDDEIALKALNDLRRKRFSNEGEYKDISGISGEKLVERIRLERRLELCFEGHRWFDLKRYGMPSIVHVWKDNGTPIQSYTLSEKDPFYVIPIPDDVLDKNKNLEQNKLPNPR